MNPQLERDSAVVPLAYPLAQTVGVQIHPDAKGCQQLICSIERMETFVSKADTVRKRLQIRSSRKRHSGRDLRDSFKETENRQVKHLFQAGYKQKGDNGSCHPFCLKRVTFPRLRSQTNRASFCRGVRREPEDRNPRLAERCCEFSNPAPWCVRSVS
jgi:hypothetical protein